MKKGMHVAKKIPLKVKKGKPKATEKKTVRKKGNGTPKTAEKLDFIRWTAMTEEERGKVKTQLDFARVYKVNDSTLSRWKSAKNFWDEVRKERNSYWKGKVGEVMNGLFKSCTGVGVKGQDAKVFLQAIGEFEERSVTVNENPMTPERREQIKQATAKWKK